MKMLKSLRLSFMALRNQLTDANSIMVLALTVAVILFLFPATGRILLEQGYTMNAFELYVLFMNGRVTQLLYVIGLLLFIYGATFFGSEGSFLAFRAGRVIWAQSQVFYAMMVSLLYNVFFLLCLWSVSWFQIDFVNEWSELTKVASQSSVTAMGARTCMVVYNNTLQIPPIQCGLLEFALCVLLGVVIGLAWIFFMQCRKLPLGIAAVFALYILDLAIHNNPKLNPLMNVSFMSLSRLSRVFEYGVSIPYIIGLFLLLIVGFDVLIAMSTWKKDIFR